MATAPMPRAQRWWLAVLAALLPVVLFVSWGIQLEQGNPGPARSLLMLLDPVIGVAALVLLPRVLHRDGGPPEWVVDPERERRALVVGVVVVLCSGVAGSAFLPGAVAVASLTARRRPGWVAAAVTSFTVAALLATLWAPPGSTRAEVLLGAAVVCAFLVLFGLYRGGRRELLRSLRREAESARRGQEAREAQARQEERTQIAREMHDTVSHRLALVALHAGALEYRDDLTPEQLRAAAAVIRQGAHEAADELRSTLHVLRSDGADARPAPALADLHRLAEGVRAAGAAVALDVRCEPGVEPPPTTVAHLYRLVQEALTNALKHAPGEPVDVVVEVADGRGVSLRASNRLAPATAATGSRLGLVGLRERVALAGGRFDAGVNGDRFVLEAWLPWPG